MMLKYDFFHCADNVPNVLLIHGLFGDKDNLTLLRKALSTHFNVMTIDLPNHGQSLHIDRWSFDGVAELISTTLKTANFTVDALVGHSLGGKVAMAYTLLAQPNTVKASVVADIAPATYSPRHDAVFHALNAVNVAPIHSRNDAAEVLNELLDEQGTIQFLLKSFKRIDGHWRWQFNLAGLERDYSNISGWPYESETKDIPVLFVKGQLSDYLNASHTDVVKKHFPKAEVKVIGGTGHWLHAEKPVIFSRIVLQFLQHTLM